MFNQIDERNCLRYQRENVITDRLIQRLELYGTLDGHEGCVNAIEWNYQGTKLCSISDDCNIIIWDPFKKKKLTQFHSNHTGNIFSAKFLEFNHENLLVTAAADHKCILHDLVTHEHLSICDCHRQRVKKLATPSQDSNLFWSAGEDGLVLQTDIRTKHVCRQDKLSNVLIDLREHCGSSAKVTSIACNPVRNELIALGSNDEFVRLYDRRMIRTMDINNTQDNLLDDCVKYFTIGNSPTKRKRDHSLACTHLTFSQTGDELLANISSDNIYLFNILHPKKPKIFSTDLTNLFGPLEDDYHSTEDYNSSFETKRLKKSTSNVSQNSDSSACSPGSKLFHKISKIAKDGLTSNPSTSTANDSINSPQVASTSRVNEEIVDDVEMEIVEHASLQLIKRINKAQKPNLIKLKAKHKIPKFIAPIYKNAQSFMKKEKYSDVIDLMNEAIAVMPNVSRFYCLRASAYCKRKWIRDSYCALKDFYRSLEIDSSNKESHLKLAQCLYELNYFENANQCLNYFRQKQSKDTRYKEFKELEKKILIALKQERQHSDKKPTDLKSKSETNYRKFVENWSRPCPQIPTFSSNSTKNNANDTDHQEQSSSSSPSSSSSSSPSTSSSTINSFLDTIEPTFFESEGHSMSNDHSRSSSHHDHWHDLSDNDSDSFQTSYDSSVHESKRTKSKKEMQWRSDSYDFDQRFYGFCNVSTDIMEANFFGSDAKYIIAGSDDGNFYIWNRKTTNIVNVINADELIVNCVQPHYNSCFIATSGLDSSVKLWSPTMNEDDLKVNEEMRKSLIRQKVEDNQKKKTTNNGINIMFFRVTATGSFANDSSDSDDDQSMGRETFNIRDCLPS